MGEIPSLTEQGKLWRAQMLYNLLSDYELIFLQLARFIDLVLCGRPYLIVRKLMGAATRPVVIFEHDKKGHWFARAWDYTKKNFYDEKIQDDVIFEGAWIIKNNKAEKVAEFVKDNILD